MLAEFWPYNAKVWREVCQIRTIVGRSWQASANIGPTLEDFAPKLGKHRPQIGQPTLEEFGRTWPCLAIFWPQLANNWPNNANFGHIRTKIQRKWPNHWPNSPQCRPSSRGKCSTTIANLLDNSEAGRVPRRELCGTYGTQLVRNVRVIYHKV